jgi:LPXTG-site transpeptidase (sortase) family protein
MKVRLITLALCILTLSLLIVPPAYASIGPNTAVLFPETGHTLAYNFRVFYETLHGRMIFGLPLTEVFLEDGRPVQYFERARLEWHADIGEVQITALGRRLTVERAQELPFQPVSAPADDSTFVTATRHTMRGAFRDFFNQFGGRAVFGDPISEEFQNLNLQNGHIYTVQYFERACFEYHPELPWPYNVSLIHLGRNYLATHPPPEAALQPVRSPDRAWNGVRANRISVPRIGIDVAVEERGTALGVWDVPLSAVGHFWPIAANPGTRGNIILGGHSDFPDRIFNHLPQIQVGDEVVLAVGRTERRYRVQNLLTVLPRETWVLQPTDTEQLTLITCVPIGVNSHRLIVRAVPVEGQ